MEFLRDAFIYLAAAVFVVPIFKRLGLGAVLGYLTAGVLIGPGGIGLISDVQSVLHFSEFGVVLLLFLIGLELQPSRLWELRRLVFGMGSLQVVGTTALLALACVAFGLDGATAFVVGAGLSLSSTAFALQLLAEKNALTAPHGKAAFGILLFQDLAVIPILAILPVLGQSSSPHAGSASMNALKVVLVLGGVIASRWVLAPLFRFIATLHMQDLFTAMALLIVVSIAMLVSTVGLSPALGAFLAGVLLAESEYRHELEADIEPFKGLLLGLFFMAVGMSINIHFVLQHPWLVVGLVLGLVVIKSLILFAIGVLSGQRKVQALLLAAVISQGGEFAFVLFAQAVQLNVMQQETADLLVAVVSLSMAVTPFMVIAIERIIARKTANQPQRAFDVSPLEDSPVIIAGFGRVGQIVARLLRAKHIPFTALDIDAQHIDFVRQFGNKVFYGDASRLDLLRSARVEKAQVFLLAIDNIDASVRTAETVIQHFPHVTIIARARNRGHVYRLMSAGVQHVVRETFFSSLEMGHDVFEALGLTYSESREALERFRDHDETTLNRAYEHRDDLPRLRELGTQARKELESLFERDATQS